MSNQQKNERRKQFWVDPKLQGALVWSAVVHWTVILLSVATVLFLAAALSDLNAPVTAVTNMMSAYLIPVVLVSLFLLPIIVIDTIRQSNKLVGAVPRFHHAMQRLADGESTSPLIVREGDYWKGMADQFNRIALRLEELEAASNEKTSSNDQEEVVSV